jgi:Tfp pilus assembly PilM family ATPase
MWTGVDISNAALKIIQVQRTIQGQFKVVGAARLKYQAPDDESKHNEVISRTLGRIFSDNGLTPENCVLGVTGKEINLRMTHIPPTQDKSRLRKMMAYEVMQIAGKSSENVYTDYAQLTLTSKTYPEIPVMVGLAKNSYIDEQIKPLNAHAANLRNICPRVIGLANALQASGMANPAETVLLLDIGQDDSEVIIQQNGHLIFARNLSGAQGNIFSLVESAVSFARTQLKLDDLSIDRYLVSGMVGNKLIDELAASFNKKVEIFNPFKGMLLDGLPLEIKEQMIASPNDMVIALGLALVGYLPDSTRISFLPWPIKKRINLYQIKLPLISACLLFVIAISILIVNAWQERQREKAVFDKLENDKKQIVQYTNQFKRLADKKTDMQVQYGRLNQMLQRGTFFYEVVNIIRQLPSEAWVKEVNFEVVPAKVVVNKGKESKDAKDEERTMIITGYLEDDTQTTLGNLKSFVDKINQPPFKIKATLDKLSKPDIGGPQMKMEFIISIK